MEKSRQIRNNLHQIAELIKQPNQQKRMNLLNCQNNCHAINCVNIHNAFDNYVLKTNIRYFSYSISRRLAIHIFLLA